MIPLAEVVFALRSHTPSRQPSGVSTTKASVALVLAGPETSLRMCFIRRSTRPEDPWSGQMALPGGRVSTSDTDVLSAAARETHEEIGLLLGPDQYLGTLSEMPIARNANLERGILSPCVFYCSRHLPSFVLCQKEVAAAYWIPVPHLWSVENRTRYTFENQSYPAIAYREEVIWGLTLRVLEAFGRVVQRPLCVE